MGLTEHGIECDGGPNCQATEHIHGCFAERTTVESYYGPSGNVEVERLRRQLAGAVEALRQLADLHHRTITGSKKHDPENRDWTECECRSCRLAQPFGG